MNDFTVNKRCFFKKMGKSEITKITKSFVIHYISSAYKK